MASLQTKSFSVKSSNGFTLKLTLTEESIDSTANTSKLSYTLTLSSGAYDFAQYTVGASISFDGTVIANRDRYNSPQLSLGTYSTITILSGSTTVTHGSDGAKSINVTYGITMASVSYTPGSLSGTGTMALTTIPRASTIGAADAYVGAVSSVVITKKTSSYTHSVAYKFGSLSGYINADGSTTSTETKFSAGTVAFTIPTAFYNQIPNAKTGTCTLTCKTYSGSTQIGDAQTANFTVRTDPTVCAPELSGTVKDTNNTTIALTGNAEMLVRYFSNAQCTITATAKNGASLSSKSINGAAVSGNTSTITSIETGSVEFKATDSRGYTASIIKNVDLVAYIKLTNNTVCSRDDATSGKATLKISGNYYSGSFGSTRNALSVKYCIDDGNWISLGSVTVASNTYTAEVSLDGLNYEQAYTVQVQVSDKLMQITKSIAIKRGIPVFDWGEKDFVFHVPVYTGDLYAPKLFVRPNAGNNYPTTEYQDSSGNRLGSALTSTSRRMGLANYPSGSSYYELFQTPTPTSGLTGNKQYDLLSTKALVTIEQGGTNAANAKAARTNLGFGATREYYGTLSSGSATFSYTDYTAIVIVGKPASSAGLMTMYLPTGYIGGSTRSLQLADETNYILFDLQASGGTGTITIKTNSGSGNISQVWGVI